MIAHLTDWILGGIRTHGILALIIGVILETIIVPLPSPLIVMTAGYILIPQGILSGIIFSALGIAVVAGLAQTIGSFILFFPCYHLGKPFIEKYEKFHGISWQELSEYKDKISKREGITIFILRALPIMPLSVISGVAGILKMDPKKYFLATFLGVIPRNFLFALIGFQFGEIYHILAGKFDNAETVITILLILLIFAYLIGNRTGLFNKARQVILR